MTLMINQKCCLWKTCVVHSGVPIPSVIVAIYFGGLLNPHVLETFFSTFCFEALQNFTISPG